MKMALRLVWCLLMLGCSQHSAQPDASVVLLDDSIVLSPWELHVRTGFYATTTGGLRFVFSDRADLCASLGPLQCVRTGTLDALLAPGVSLQVGVTGVDPRVYEFPEVSARFLGASSSNRFVANARAGRVEVVGSPPSILSLDLELETGATVKGRFAIAPCQDAALVRPLGGLSCKVTATSPDCDAGFCPEPRRSVVTERCTCGSREWTGVCQTVSTIMPNRISMTCQCDAPARASTCSVVDFPTAGLTSPTCCDEPKP